MAGITVKVRVMPEFLSTLRKYRQYSKRDPKVICDTKAFFIARRAVIETPKASAAKIRGMAQRQGGAIMGKILNTRRGKGRGLYGQAMADEVAMVMAARLRSVAFLKSGWIKAIKTLEPLAEKRGAPRADRTAKEYGQAKGWARPAQEAWVCKSIIANLVQAKWDEGGAEGKGVAALEKAFEFETQSMKDHIERKMRQSAEAAGIKTAH